MSVDYEDRFDFVFNRRVALANGGTAWLTICANLLSDSELGEVFAFDDHGEDISLTSEEYQCLEEYIHQVRRDWLADW